MMLRTLLLLLALAPTLAVAAPTSSDPVLEALEAELDSLRVLVGATGEGSAIAAHALFGDHPASFIGLQAIEVERVRIVGEEGGLQGGSPLRGRWIHADVRVGPPTLDSTHPLRDGSWDDASSGRTLPVGDDVSLLRRGVRREAEVRYRAAVDRYQRVLSDQQLLVAEAGAYDLAPAEPLRLLEDDVSFAGIDWAPWEATVRALSAGFADSDVALDPSVSLVAEREVRWFVSTDGHASRSVDTRVRLVIAADTLAPDGSALHEDASFDGRTVADLPDREALLVAATGVRDRLAALRAAPEEPPYRGPALLSGRAAAVFFHEILGHRVEGHRLKQIADAQTFRDKVGEPVLPPFLTVIDDPTRERLDGLALRGHYRIDDQGVAAEPAVLIEGGVLRGFLESRSPVGAGARSNGHGRRQAGLEAVTRQGNLLITSSTTRSDAALESELVALARADGLPYALLVDDLEGGFTFTDRDLPNAFQIDVRTAWRIYVDGRPRELVRGVDLIGTPLQTFSRIVATGERLSVFNGTCGAESGWVPVSAAAPSMLLAQVESQRKLKGQTPPPLTAPPGGDAEPTTGQPLLDGLLAELARAQAGLRIEGAPPPSRIVIETWDHDAWEVTAEFGVLVGAGGGRSRPSRVEVVVEDKGLSSLRFEGGGGIDVPDASRHPSFVVEDVIAPIRRDLWLSADSSYRAAVQRLNLKQAAAAARPDAGLIDVWSPSPPRVAISSRAAAAVDRDKLAALALAASAAAREVPGLRGARASAREEQGVLFLVSTEGTRVAQPGGVAALHIEIEALRADGVPVRDRLAWVTGAAAQLPSAQMVSVAVIEAGRALAARAGAPVVPFFEGPVVFEGEAAADLFRYLLGPELRGTPPAPEAGTSAAAQARGAPRLGRRVLPPGWRVRDDPDLTPAGLAGPPPIDREGVAVQSVQLVDDGVVVDLLRTRAARPDGGASNGHAFGGLRAAAEARFGWWRVAAPRGLAERPFWRRVVSERKAARVEAVLVVRRLADGWDGALPEPTDAVWRGADGTERPAVGLEFEHVDRRTLRQVVAARSAEIARPYLGSVRAVGMAPSTRGQPMGIIAPMSVLVSDLEVAFGGESQEPELLPLVELSR